MGQKKRQNTAKKQRVFVLLVCVTFILFLLFFGFYSFADHLTLFQKGESFVGQAYHSRLDKIQLPTCSDTDYIGAAKQKVNQNTFNPNLFGKITYSELVKENGKAIVKVKTEPDACKDKINLKEWSCQNYDPKNLVHITDKLWKMYQCPFGCDTKNGNCFSEQNCNDGVKNGDETGIDCGGKNCKACVVKQFCEDSDGLNFSNKGFTTTEIKNENGTLENITITDSCADAFTVVENGCNEKGYIEQQQNCFSLNATCIDGACMHTDKCIETDNGLDVFKQGQTKGLLSNGAFSLSQDKCGSVYNLANIIESKSAYVDEFYCAENNANASYSFEKDPAFCPEGYWCYNGACSQQKNNCEDFDQSDWYKDQSFAALDVAGYVSLLQLNGSVNYVNDSCADANGIAQKSGAYILEAMCDESNTNPVVNKYKCGDELFPGNQWCYSARCYLIGFFCNSTSLYYEGASCIGKNSVKDCDYNSFIVSGGTLDTTYKLQFVVYPQEDHHIRFDSINFDYKTIAPTYLLYIDNEPTTFQIAGVPAFTLTINETAKSITFTDLGSDLAPEIKQECSIG